MSFYDTWRMNQQLLMQKRKDALIAEQAERASKRQDALLKMDQREQKFREDTAVFETQKAQMLAQFKAIQGAAAPTQQVDPGAGPGQLGLMAGFEAPAAVDEHGTRAFPEGTQESFGTPIPESLGGGTHHIGQLLQSLEQNQRTEEQAFDTELGQAKELVGAQFEAGAGQREYDEGVAATRRGHEEGLAATRRQHEISRDENEGEQRLRELEQRTESEKELIRYKRTLGGTDDLIISEQLRDVHKLDPLERARKIDLLIDGGFVNGEEGIDPTSPRQESGWYAVADDEITGGVPIVVFKTRKNANLNTPGSFEFGSVEDAEWFYAMKGFELPENISIYHLDPKTQARGAAKIVRLAKEKVEASRTETASKKVDRAHPGRKYTPEEMERFKKRQAQSKKEAPARKAAAQRHKKKAAKKKADAGFMRKTFPNFFKQDSGEKDFFDFFPEQ